MCGIFGIIGNHSKINIKEALNAIKHRGPDDEGEYSDENVKLGFRRLSIIDLSPKGHQPMSNEDSTVWIVFNGEIYNYQEIKKELIGKHNFKSSTDTEVLIHGYEQWGIDGLLNRINGMFAFCLYDKSNKEAYLVRDRIGKRPLYYFKSNRRLTFSSEVKAFFSLNYFKYEIDEQSFKMWMGFPYLPDNEKTLIKNVYKVPPGSYLKIKLNGNVSLNKYWQIKENKIDQPFEDIRNDLEKILIDSVTKRLIADVPVGVLLSGGLDSSLITAIASKYSKNKIKTVNISFPGSGIDERKYAEEVANHCNTNHIALTLDVKDIYNQFKLNIGIYDDLSTVDSGLFSTYLLSKKIREIGVKVILVGEGADEIFAGYTWFQLSQYPLRFLPDNIKAWFYYYAIMRNLPNKKFFDYSNILLNKMNETSGSFLKKIQRYEIDYSLPNHYCMKVDKGSMAASVEARAPYMDHRIAEFAANINDKYLLNSSIYNPKVSNEKFILRQIAKDYLPPSIAQRKKRGGMIPLYNLLNRGLTEDKQLILSNNYLLRFYGKEYLSELIETKPTLFISKWQREWILWKCLVFSLWQNHFKNL
ncbi:MAG: asparagine synthase (glutamine-hydrolyzing) [Candidatus Roizmanbacteria bacterium]|nr:MAG: asparagine synthase (glutamine-hydrolyzing) [Candidatus Roizmanbacteria bacterium]